MPSLVVVVGNVGAWTQWIQRERERENSNRTDRLRPLLKLLGEAPAKAGHTDIPTTWCLA